MIAGDIPRIKITDCSDGLFWYSHLVGEVVELIRPPDSNDEVYWTRANDGFLNTVMKCDAELIVDKKFTRDLSPAMQKYLGKPAVPPKEPDYRMVIGEIQNRIQNSHWDRELLQRIFGDVFGALVREKSDS